MQAAHMTFEEEVIKSRSELKHLRLENARVKRSNEQLRNKILQLEQKNHRLQKENHLFKHEQYILTQKLHQQEKQLESLKLIVEELRRIVFGKKKTRDEDKKSTGQTNDTNTKEEQRDKRKSANRTDNSYRRDTPKDEEITDTYEHPITHCPNCGTFLISLKQIIRYREDIANIIELAKLLKRVEKHIIHSGYCPKCRRRKTAKEVSSQVNSLGENVKKFVAYLIVIMRLSFEQVKCFLSDTADFQISDGEIVVILDEQADKLLPERDRILAKIRGSPGRHYDETGWTVQKEGEGNYAWINRPTTGEEAVFLMGRSRGKGNAEKLQGEIDNQVGISDDYGAYQNMFKKHQLCMAHPKRKLRDLSESKTLSQTSNTLCIKTHESFSFLYEDLEKTLASDYQKNLWLKKRDEYINRLKEIAVVTEADPEKLKAIKQGLRDNVEKYFTCLLQPGIPADNNKAERGLRHIVLKRKISYGSKSQKGADTMSILCSTLLSAWWSKPASFFVAYNQMLNP